jgi:hypothetical protein
VTDKPSFDEVVLHHGPTVLRVRHGVSTVYSGQRYTLGILFHDAP